MKIAIPSQNNTVDSHFGHCSRFTIFTADEDRTIIHKEVMDAPEGCGCKSNLAGIFQQIGVNVLLAGGIGQGAINVLNQHGIQVLRGCTGDVQQLAERFLKDTLVDSGESCQHPHQHHGHGGNHGECKH